MDGRIDAIIAGGTCRHGIESTVVDMTGETPCVLRPGVITPEMIALVLGKEVGVDPALLALEEGVESAAAPKAPGMKYKHYAPKARVTIYDGGCREGGGEQDQSGDVQDSDGGAVRDAMQRDAAELERQGKKVVILDFDNEEDAARNLFAALRKADDDGAEHIVIAAVSREGIGFAVMNRMLKAAGYNVKHIGG